MIFLKESFVEILSWFIVVKKQFPANYFRKLELYSLYKISTFMTRAYGKEFVLPRRRLAGTAADDNFVILHEINIMIF